MVVRSAGGKRPCERPNAKSRGPQPTQSQHFIVHSDSPGISLEMLALKPGIFCRTAPRVGASEHRQEYVRLGISIEQSWYYTDLDIHRQGAGSEANSWTKRENDATLRGLGVAIDRVT